MFLIYFNEVILIAFASYKRMLAYTQDDPVKSERRVSRVIHIPATTAFNSLGFGLTNAFYAVSS